MRKTSYNSFEEWKLDMDRVRAHPNDQHLFNHVARCVENSNEDVQVKVREYLLSLTLETNPWMVFDEVAKASPGHQLFVKNRNDPWFTA